MTKSSTKTSFGFNNIYKNQPDFSYSAKAVAALCKKNPDNEICTRMHPTAEENRNLSLSHKNFKLQITGPNQLRKSTVRKGGKRQTKKNKTNKRKTRRYKR